MYEVCWLLRAAGAVSCMEKFKKNKGKGKIYPITDHESPEGE
jgi:hypothetical protein